MSEVKNIYFMGIGGTGMAAVAGLCKLAGYNVTGSDKGVYPPMSLMLEELGFTVMSPYSEENIKKVSGIDLVVVANTLSRNNPELEYMLAHGYRYTSFPGLMEELFLKKMDSIVISGTHGKTTTSALLAHVLLELNENPSYLIGGVPQGEKYSFKLAGNLFVIEGDEYDTAFFDKNSKFLHYCPRFLILNNLEFDHADIFKSIEDIKVQFKKLIALVPNKKNIICNVDDPVLTSIIEKLGVDRECIRVSTLGKTSTADIIVSSSYPITAFNWGCTLELKSDRMKELYSTSTLEIQTKLCGVHNMANVSQVFALISALIINGKIKPHSLSSIQKAFSTFSGVKRRLQFLGSKNQIEVYEDFAHHPTAIKTVIQGIKQSFPNKRLTVAYEPANATGKRNVLMKDFASSLSLADRVLIGVCPEDKRIPEKDRLNTHTLKDLVGSQAVAFDRNEDILNYLKDTSKPDDIIVFMSSSSFSDIQHKILDIL